MKAGISFLGDKVEETVATDDYARNEIVPGIYTEWTYLNGEKFTAVGGLRYDHHNLYGGFVTPRVHLRYAPSENTVWRAVLGRGQKTASIFGENLGLFASSRNINIIPSNEDNPYGLNPEVAWNYGLSLQKDLSISDKRFSIGLDAYYTDFTDQVVVDYDQDYRQVFFYNLEGKSYSTSLQGLLEFSLTDRLDIRLAYRYNDVQTDFQTGRDQLPLIAPHRAFANVSYETENGWKLDLTINRIGSQRIPETPFLSETEDIRSDPYFLGNTQISKIWNNRVEWYLGGENIFNFQQPNPILNAENPFSEGFDASLIYGPVFGTTIYTGFRFKLFNEGAGEGDPEF